MKKPALLLTLSFALVSLACETIAPLLPPPPEELDLWADADAGVTDPVLAELCRAVWEAELRHNPFQATYLGDPRWNGKIPDTSLNGRSAWKTRLTSFRRRLDAIHPAALGSEDRLTAELLGETLDDAVMAAELDVQDWSVDPLEGPHVRMLNLAAVQPYATQRQREQLVERWEAFPSYLGDAGNNLLRARGAGRVASRTAIEKTLRQIDEILAVPPHRSPLVEPATQGARWVDFPAGANLAALAHAELGDAREQSVLLRLNKHLSEPQRVSAGTHLLLPSAGDTLTIEERGEYLYDVLRAVELDIYPALREYREILEKRILASARDDDHPGLKHVDGGDAIYRKRIHLFTSLPAEECDPKKIHEYGLEEVRRIRAEIAQLGGKVFGTREVAAIQARLRGDPELHFRTREEVAAKAGEALGRARARMGGFFGIVPLAPCEVVPVPGYEEANTTIAYYREPAPDGSRPGRYYINTSAPETRPRYEAEVLAFHEAIPGHHLQIAIAQERDDLPRFRRHLGCTAYVEGWALYTERLCDEMGLYSADLDRLGMLSFDAWRASRLVVDTGLHALGWSRDDAIDYLFDNTLLAANNVETEVDRYIAWPGQALAYKLGQREILALREEARKALGPGFRYPEFHDRLLENGAVTLSTLRTHVRGWLGSNPAVEAAAPR